MGTVLKIEGVSHWFGDNRVLDNINIEIEQGSITSLVGPSGCGKSTLLRAIVGTHPAREGRIRLRDGHSATVSFSLGNNNSNIEIDEFSNVNGPGRDRGIVYQKYSLFPTMTAIQNVAAGLMFDETSILFRLSRPIKWRKIRREHLGKAAIMLEKVGLGHAINKYPKELSGGMQQRVAIAQALIMEPRILLLDEPFGALDEATRERLQKMLLEFYKENQEAKRKSEEPPYTIMLVTHELNEAIYVGSRILGLSQYRDRKSGETDSRGATIVLDESCPIFDPTDEKDHSCFEHLKDRIINEVYEPEEIRFVQSLHDAQQKAHEIADK